MTAVLIASATVAVVWLAGATWAGWTVRHGVRVDRAGLDALERIGGRHDR